MNLRTFESASLGTIAINTDKITFLSPLGPHHVEVHMGTDHSVTVDGQIEEVIEKLS